MTINLIIQHPIILGQQNPRHLVMNSVILSPIIKHISDTLNFDIVRMKVNRNLGLIH